MKTSSVLVNYCGYPNSVNNLMLDNGMANLAGSLLENGHETLIMDFATLDTVRNFYPVKFHAELSSLVENIMSSFRNHREPESSALERLREIEIHVEDFQREKLGVLTRQLMRTVAERKCDFVGFKLWTGEGFIGSIAMAQSLREEFPDLKIYAGGPHNDYFKQLSLQEANVFDAIIYGEGEQVIRLLAEHAVGERDLASIPNVIYNHKGLVVTTKEDMILTLDDLPRPTYDVEVYPAMKGNQKVKVVPVDESRGCPKKCNFCIHTAKSGNRWRLKDATRFVQELAWMSDQYGFHVFRFAGSNTPSKLQREIAHELKQRQLNFTYGAFTTAGYLRDYSELKQAGCYALFFGIESGSQRLLDEVHRKGVTREVMLGSLKKCKASGIFTVASLIVPSPMEDERSRQDTVNLILESRPDTVLINLPGLVHGTAWGNNYVNYGFELENPSTFYQTMMRYRVKNTYPPELWNPLPYKVNGKDFRAMVQESGDFARLMTRNGIPVGISDELALIASCTDMTPAEFHEKNISAFSAADFDKIESLVRAVNRGALIS
ncbi:B12-binding domain-containing radical SAM protein [Candidatus Woesearchaeota archaeon]|nr:B12-binding domain-containing radical SAM protein [Candidatus Woesearchaeota archaeon]